MNGIIRLDRLTIFVAESLRRGRRGASPADKPDGCRCGDPFGSSRRNAPCAALPFCSLLIRTPSLGFLAAISAKTGRRDFGPGLRGSEGEWCGFGREERE